jgi:hypothetical protein
MSTNFWGKPPPPLPPGGGEYLYFIFFGGGGNEKWSEFAEIARNLSGKFFQIFRKGEASKKQKP